MLVSQTFDNYLAILEINYQKQKLLKAKLPKSPTMSNLPEFPWDDRWLRGYEYEYMLNHYALYSKMYDMPIFSSHPIRVYSTPKNGEIYFLSNKHLRQFGFPRVDDLEKKMKWKKMNFTTDLPKHNPQVKYLVSSGKYRSKSYRMHVVVLAHEYDRHHSVTAVNSMMESKSGMD